MVYSEANEHALVSIERTLMSTATEPQPDPRPHPDDRIEADLRASERDEEHLHQVEAELHSDERRLEQDLHERPEPSPSHLYNAQMNYHSLTLRGHRLTGHQIKGQAIAAGIPNIQPNFHLTVERAGHDTEHTVSDTEEWTVHDGDSFTAVKPDDNS
jgi:hypothetical protein